MTPPGDRRQNSVCSSARWTGLLSLRLVSRNRQDVCVNGVSAGPPTRPAPSQARVRPTSVRRLSQMKQVSTAVTSISYLLGAGSIVGPGISPLLFGDCPRVIAFGARGVRGRPPLRRQLQSWRSSSLSYRSLGKGLAALDRIRLPESRDSKR